MIQFYICFAIFFVLCCEYSVLSYPQGAPVRTESCVNLQPVHIDPLSNQQVRNQQGTTRPYRILVSQQQYRACTSTQQCGLQPLQGSPVTPDACVQLIPRHPNQMFLNNPSVFALSPSTSYYRFCEDPGLCGRNYIGVSIQGQGGLFRGFIIQARTPNGGSRSWGQFIPLQTGDSKVIQCQNGLTLTHTANNDKNIVRFAWIPEPGMREQVQFVATVVQNLRTIYPGVYSSQLRPVGVPQPTTTKPPLTTNMLVPTISSVTPIPTTKSVMKTTTTTSTTTYLPVTSATRSMTSSTKFTTTSSQPSETITTEVVGSAPMKTAGLISLVTSVIAILL